MPTYAIADSDEGECYYCEEQAPYLYLPDRRVDGGLDQPVRVAVWACKECLITFDDDVEGFYPDLLVRELELSPERPYNEWRPE